MTAVATGGRRSARNRRRDSSGERQRVRARTSHVSGRSATRRRRPSVWRRSTPSSRPSRSIAGSSPSLRPRPVAFCDGYAG